MTSINNTNDNAHDHLILIDDIQIDVTPTDLRSELNIIQDRIINSNSEE